MAGQAGINQEVMKKETAPQRSILVFVAHPDDQTLWCGGTILMHPEDAWLVACLSRGLALMP